MDEVFGHVTLLIQARRGRIVTFKLRQKGRFIKITHVGKFMNKKPLFLVVIILFLSISVVSASYFFGSQYRINDFKEITEFRQTTEQKVGDYWNFESTKRTITEKTEVRKRTRTPSYNPYYSPYGNSYSPYSRSYGNYYNPRSNYYVSQSNWRFKEPYRYDNYANSRYNDYYYKPRYDPYQGYYNWRW